MQSTVEKAKQLPASIWRWLGTTLAWRIILIVFGVQASLIAIAGRFSMAFDEYYHLGLIQLYSKVWLPWQVTQPDGPAYLSAIETNSSFMYHYLMSFIYRILYFFTQDQTILIVLMRLIDIAIVIVGLILFRKLIRMLGASASAANFIILVLSLMPVTSFLAGQLTYDSLFFTATAGVLLMFVSILSKIDAKKTPDLSYVVFALALLISASLIKYAFLPMTLAIGVFSLGFIVYTAYKNPKYIRKVFSEWKLQIKSRQVLLAFLALIISLSFFIAIDGRNLIKYKTPNPGCEVVLDEARCMGYDPWRRDATYISEAKPDNISQKRLDNYPKKWFKQMIREMFFSVGPRESGYAYGAPLPVSLSAGWIIAVFSLILIILALPKITKGSSSIKMIFVLVMVYIGVLYIQNYYDFRRTGVEVAIHGRYILQLLPLIGFLAYLGVRKLIEFAPRTKTYLLVSLFIIVVALSYGGGAMPFIIRSQDSWIWPSLVSASQDIRSLIWPFIIK